MSIWRDADRLYAHPPKNRITLGEGNTPLVRSRRLGPAAGLNRLYFKLDYCNPTGSYKDRFAAAAVSYMVENGKNVCLATSSGNTGSSLAAYCAAAGIRCEIAIVHHAPIGKLRQMMCYGADIYRIEGFGVDAAVSDLVIARLKERATAPAASLQISAYKFCPEGMVGVETLGYELARHDAAGEFDGRLAHVFCQAGGGGLTLAVCRGLETMVREGIVPRSPKVHCVQPAGNDTIVTPLREGAAQGRTVFCTTQVSGLQVPSVIDGDAVIDAVRRCGGTGWAVEDAETFAAQARLAREEGIFCEPGAAVPVAGALKAAAERGLDPDDVVVCTITGFAFKDPPSVERMLNGVDCPLITPDQFLARV
ncbi:MAG: pyridoxal-phosphate dependent enzyme [Planctomycetia bacterium]